MAERLIVGEIPGEPPGFVDRAELTDLTGLLSQRGRVAVCAGGRGVGKSALAAAYARAAIADPDGPRVVVWLSGETEVALVTGLSVLAQRANLTAEGENSEQSAARARDYLTGLGVPGLLVVDNAENPDLVRRWLPTGPACRVVLTSTDQTFTVLAAPVQLGIYARHQSVAYLAERTGIDDSYGAAEVADTLGDLPLALAQAAGVITAQRLTYARYLTRLAATPLAAGLPATPGYPRGLAAAIRLSVDTATVRHSGTATVLDVLSVLSPSGVTRALLAALLTTSSVLAAQPNSGMTEDEVDEIVGILSTGSLVTVSADLSSVSMHRLVARSLRENGASVQAFDPLMATATALRGALPEEGSPPPDTAFVEDISNQTVTLLRHGDHPDILSEIVQSVCDIASTVGIWLYTVGAYTETVTINERVLTTRERLLGPDHPDTLTTRHNLAAGYQSVGRHQEAIALDEGTLAARERVLGPEHLRTLDSQHGLAADYRSVGRYDEAIALDEATLAVRERVLGPEHPDTLRSRNNLAHDYRRAGHSIEAIALNETTLAARERVLGRDHPDTLESRHGLAASYRAAGRQADAIAVYEATLAGRERVLGPDHPATLRSRSNLAACYRSVNRYDEALALDEATLSARERALGPDHPATLTTRNGLAADYRLVGRHDEAIALHKATLAARERLLGLDHPDTMHSSNGLATDYRSAGRFDEAIALFEATLAARVRVLGPDHPDTLTSRHNLSEALQQGGVTSVPADDPT